METRTTIGSQIGLRRLPGRLLCAVRALRDGHIDRIQRSDRDDAATLNQYCMIEKRSSAVTNKDSSVGQQD